MKARSGIDRARAALSCAALGCSIVLALPAVAPAQLQTVLYKKGPGPVLQSEYRAFRRPDPGDNDDKEIAFRGRVRGGILGSSKAVFSADPDIDPTGTVEAKQRDGGPNGLDDGTYRRFERPTINVDGDVAFQAKLSAGERGIFRRDDGALDVQNVSRVEDPVPGMVSPAFLSNFGRAFITDDDEVLFHASIKNPTPSSANEGIFRCTDPAGDCSLFSGTPANLEAMLFRGDPIDDQPTLCSGSPLTICNVAEDEFGVSTWGISFRATTKCDCTDNSEPANTGIFRIEFATGTIETIAMRGDCTSIGTQRTYRDFDGIPEIEDDGVVAFLAETSASGEGVRDAIFRCDSATCARCTATFDCDISCGSPMPEALVQEDYQYLPGRPIDRFGAVGISNTEDVSFRARDTFVRDYGIFLYDDGSGTVSSLLLEGDDAQATAGFPAAATFRRVLRPTMSPAGRIAFRAKLKSSLSTLGLFLYE